MHENLAIGAAVITLDGDELGTVKEIRGDLFKVDAPMQPDYWLECECIRGAFGGGIEVAFPKERLNDFKRDLTA
jgi:hypothetical protein